MVKLKLNTSTLAAEASSGSGRDRKSTTPKASTPKIKLKTKSSGPTLKIRSSSLSQQHQAGINQHAAASTMTAAAIPPPPPPPLRTPILKFKPPKPLVPRKRRHEPGNGYDSEASDREEDPAIEEQFILRMQPGEDCDYLREVIEKKELNVTTDVWLKFKDSRRAVVCVRGHLYGALLVDLPCIIESNKTLDKKTVFKAADICQMLLVGDRIANEDEANYIQTRPQDTTYPHGITAPMQYARKRRFRKRISNRTIEAVEAEVDRLLKDDERAESTKFSLVDAAELAREGSVVASDAGDEGYDLLGSQTYDDEQDAEGEIEYDYPVAGLPGDEVEVEDDTLAIDLESALMDGMEGVEFDSTAAGPQPTTTSTVSAAAAPNNNQPEEDSDDDEDEDEEETGDLDEDATEAAQEREKLRGEIKDLEETIRAKTKEFVNLNNPILKVRVGKVITSLQSELDLKIMQSKKQ